jgi:hypothetical protein
MSAVLDRSPLLVLEISGSTFSIGDAGITTIRGILRPGATVKRGLDSDARLKEQSFEIKFYG